LNFYKSQDYLIEKIQKIKKEYNNSASDTIMFMSSDTFSWISLILIIIGTYLGGFDFGLYVGIFGLIYLVTDRISRLLYVTMVLDVVMLFIAYRKTFVYGVKVYDRVEKYFIK
jgi:hypothetical protein